MNEIELHAQVERATRAREVLDNELYKGAFVAIRQMIIDEWQKSPARDEEGRERLYLMQSLLKMLENHLRSHIETGVVASGKLASLQEPKRFGIF